MSVLIFPTVHGESVAGKSFTLPYGLEGEFNVLLLAYEPAHQLLLQSWMPTLSLLQKQYPRLSFYQVAVLEDYDAAQREMIDLSMQQGILDPRLREIVITLYLDKAPFNALLDIESERTITLLLLDHAGHVLWRDSGMFNSAKLELLRAALVRAHRTDNEPS